MEMEEARAILADLWDADSDGWQRHWAPVFRTFAVEVVRRAAPRPGERLIDIGTGTGTALLEAAPLVGAQGRAVGIDHAPGQLEKARRASAGLPGVELRQMDAASLDFPDQTFDVALSSSGIPFVGVQESLSEIRRVLRPGGRFAWAQWHIDDVGPLRVFNEVLGRHKVDDPGPRLRRIREAQAEFLTVGGPVSHREDIEGAFERAGFSTVAGDSVTHTIRSFTVDSFVQARLARTTFRLEAEAMTPGGRAAFNAAIRAALGPFVREGPLEIPWPVVYWEASGGAPSEARASRRRERPAVTRSPRRPSGPSGRPRSGHGQ